MKKTVYTLTGAFAAVLMTTSMAFAFSNNANENADDGQAKAQANCVANIQKQNGNGQTGAETGNNDHDPKVLETAVTECDQFWKGIGAIGNPD